MLRSMTAFGRSSLTLGERDISVEIKSVNNRFLDCSVRLPRSLSYLEDRVKKELTSRGISRGKIEINITVVGERELEISLDKSFVSSYLKALCSLRDEFGLHDDISVMTVARNNEVFTLKRPEQDEDKEWQELSAALSEAIDGFISMREKRAPIWPPTFSERSRSAGDMPKRSPHFPRQTSRDIAHDLRNAFVRCLLTTA